MRIEYLEDKIRARAKQDVKTAFRALQGEVFQAVVKFAASVSPSIHGYPPVHGGAMNALRDMGQDLDELLTAVTAATPVLAPGVWNARENAIREEVLRTMDSLQQTLLAKPVAGDGPVPAEPPAADAPVTS